MPKKNVAHFHLKNAAYYYFKCLEHFEVSLFCRLAQKDPRLHYSLSTNNTFTKFNFMSGCLEAVYVKMTQILIRQKYFLVANSK